MPSKKSLVLFLWIVSSGRLEFLLTFLSWNLFVILKVPTWQPFNSRMELSISDHCVYLASSRTSEQRLKLSRWMRNELVLSNEHTELHSLIILYCVIWCYYYILCFNYFHYKFTLSYPENNLPPVQIWEQTSCLLCNLLIKTDHLFWL